MDDISPNEEIEIIQNMTDSQKLGALIIILREISNGIANIAVSLDDFVRLSVEDMNQNGGSETW